MAIKKKRKEKRHLNKERDIHTWVTKKYEEISYGLNDLALRFVSY